ncbi:MAG TPA: thiamine diphosphokinase, partial [Bacillales bacterium]|nr:thiamine diphosphokinase [Bacillales bacterium]
VSVYGATGGRLDHEWVNFQLLKKGIGTNVKVVLEDRQNVLTASGPGRYELKQIERFPYVSFLPLHESINGLTLEGFKYPLQEAEVKAGSTLTVSNELIGETGTYSLSSGIVLVVRTRDYD